MGVVACHGRPEISHLFNARHSGASLIGVIDDDTFKRGKLFHGYPVLGSISDHEQILPRNAFDEILIAQDDLRGGRLNSLRSFAGGARIEPASVLARRERYQPAKRRRPICRSCVWRCGTLE